MVSESLIYPLTFDPQFRDYIWGGRSLEKLFRRKLPPGIVAESWEISGHPSSPTHVQDGPLAGMTLPQVQEQLGRALVGNRSQWAIERKRFPLLVKLLDAHQRLSVQVHPPDEYALQNEDGELGKTEMWYVLHAEPGTELIYGLAQETTPETFYRALEEGWLPDLLHYLPVEAGDAVFVPPGTLHAVLEGLVIAEIQQNSDVTYRVYDWGRVDAEGKPRPLHVDKAIDVIHWDMVRPHAYRPMVIVEEMGLRRAEISRCPYFVVEEVRLETGIAYQGQCDGSTFEIWGCVAGQAQVHWAGESRPLGAIQYILLPAALGNFAIQARGPATLLRAYAPQ